MIKKFLKTGLIIFILLLSNWSMVLAKNSTNPLLPIVPPAPGSKIQLVQQLPALTGPELFGIIIKLTLSVVGALAFISFTVGGVMMVTANGQEDKMSKGKKILLWSLLALAIIATSYAIVLGITQLKFFQ